MAETPTPPNSAALDAFWAAAKAACPAVKFPAAYRARCIGSTRATAAQILKFVVRREKVGTFPLPWHLENTKQSPPAVGEFTILLSFDGDPTALVRTSSVDTLPLSAVTDHHTAIDGPPIRALAVWKPIHVDSWTRLLAGTGRTVTDDMPVFVERFDLVYAPEAPFYLPAGPDQPSPTAIKKFFDAAEAQNPRAGLNGNVHVRWIGLDPPSTDQIIDLIKIRDKTGTFTLPWIIARTDNRMPKAGDALVLVDYAGQPALAVKLTRVYETRFGAVTAADTAVDGTPVRDLAVWKPMHTQYWTALLQPFGLTVSDDMPVLIEQFELIHAR